MNMILNVEFKNYRSFKNDCVFTMEPNKAQVKLDNLCEITLPNNVKKNVLKISAFLGANASGKTNVIKFLYGFKRWVKNLDNRTGEGIPLYDPFKFDDKTVNSPIDFKMEFIVKNILYRYELQFDKKSIIQENLNYYPKGRPVVLFERELPKEENESFIMHRIKPGASVSGFKPFSVFNNQLLLSKFIIDTPSESITPASKYLADIIVSNGYYDNYKSKTFNDVVEWLEASPERKNRLKHFLEFTNTGVNGFSINKLDGNYEVSSLHKKYVNDKNTGLVSLPLAEESFGTRSLFTLGCYILQALETGSPLFADEIDSGLHTYITQLIVNIFRNKRINKHNSQFIFTTHDINILDQNIMRRDQIWFVEKSKLGVSDLFSLSDFVDVREDTPFSKWYLNDKFGGVPKLQSLERLF